MSRASIRLSDLPALGQPLDGGTFTGITTQPDGTHIAVVLLPDQGEDLDHGQAVAWAAALGGALPTKPIAAMLVANAKSLLRPAWHWLAEPEGASYACVCNFIYGYQFFNHKSFEGSAVAVRCIPLIP